MLCAYFSVLHCMGSCKCLVSLSLWYYLLHLVLLINILQSYIYPKYFYLYQKNFGGFCG